MQTFTCRSLPKYDVTATLQVFHKSLSPNLYLMDNIDIVSNITIQHRICSVQATGGLQ